MKGRGQVLALFYEYWIALIRSQHIRLPADAANDGSTNEDRFEIAFDPRCLQARDAAVELAPVSVALHIDVHEAERRLRRIGNLRSEQNGAGAGSEDRALLAKLAQRIEQLFFFEQLH